MPGLESIEELIRKIESTADPGVRATAQELIRLVMELHGAALERMLEIVRTSGDAGEDTIQKLGRDELVGSLLILYGLHPLDVEARVTQALDKVSVRLRSHGGEVKLLSMDDGGVRLMLHANGNAQSLKQIVEEAVYQCAPDVRELVIEGAGDKQSFVPLEMLRGSRDRI